MDLFIIYFACGAPFGVYQITAIAQPVTAKAVALIVLRICCWPAFAAPVLIQWLSKDQHSAASNLDRRIDDIRAEIESLVFANVSVSSIFDFREVVHRYAGLSEAANVAIAPNSTNEVFELTNTENKQIASACLTRKNRRKLSFHQSLARNEFVDMISELANADIEREKILRLAVVLANGVNDPKTANALTAMMDETQFTSGMALEPQIPVIKSRSASSPV